MNVGFSKQFRLAYNAVKGEHMFNATNYLLILTRKVIILSLIAHNDSVSTRTANNYTY